MNQNLINNVNSHKHLGLTFSQDCSRHDHLELVKTKAWLRINIMRRLKFQLDRKSLQTIYTGISFIRPLLEYADVVWDNCTQHEANFALFQKNTIDNPVCECGEIENTSHFFLHCNLYGHLRHALLDRASTYCQPTVNVFL